jgi:hypothetical protein
VSGNAFTQAMIALAASPNRGPDLINVSFSVSEKPQVLPARSAVNAPHPGRPAIPANSRADVMTISGCARRTYSGLRCGNGPNAAGTALANPKRVSSSPMKELALAAYGASDISK